MKGERLAALYRQERARLLQWRDADSPAGEYAFPVFGEGDPDAPALLIGEAPGAEETKQGRPFTGKAGRQLDELIACASLDRSALFITNVVKYRPVIRSARSVRNRTPDRHEVARALPLLAAEIDILRPKIIVTLGNTPLRAVMALAGERPAAIGDVHGIARPMHIAGNAYLLFAMYHPASGIYNRALVDVMRRDAALLGEHLVKRGESSQTASVLCYTDG